MKRIACQLVATAAVVTLALPAAAQEGNPLTVEEALRLSLERQPSLSAFERRAQASEAAAVAAGQLPDLRLSVGIQNFPVTGDDAFSLSGVDMTMRTVGVSREQVRGSTRSARAERLRAEGAVSLGEQQVLARRIQREVLLAWTTIVEAQHKQRALTNLIQRLEGRREAAEADVPTGRATAADVVAIRAEVGAARAELAEARGNEAEGRAALARWLGDVARRPLSGSVPMCPAPSRAAALASVDNHPLLEVVRRQGTVAERAIAVARAERRPNWGWSAMYGQRAGDRADVVSLMVSFDLPLNRSRLQNQRILEATELAAAARDTLEDTRRELLAQLEQALAEHESAEARLEATNTLTLPALRAAEQALEARYAAGGGDLTTVLAARERTTRTELQLAEQLGAAGRASANLLFYIDECGA